MSIVPTIWVVQKGINFIQDEVTTLEKIDFLRPFQKVEVPLEFFFMMMHLFLSIDLWMSMCSQKPKTKRKFTWLLKLTWCTHFVLGVTSTFILMSSKMQEMFSLHFAKLLYTSWLKMDLIAIKLMTIFFFDHHEIGDQKKFGWKLWQKWQKFGSRLVVENF